MGRSQGTIVQRAIIGPLASLVGVPHTAPQGATVHDAFPPFPPTQKKKKKKKNTRACLLLPNRARTSSTAHPPIVPTYHSVNPPATPQLTRPCRASPCTSFLAISWDLIYSLCAGVSSSSSLSFSSSSSKDGSNNNNKVLGKQQSQRQLPTAVRRDGPCVRALGTLFLIYHRSLSHLVAR